MLHTGLSVSIEIGKAVLSLGKYSNDFQLPCAVIFFFLKSVPTSGCS